MHPFNLAKEKHKAQERIFQKAQKKKLSYWDYVQQFVAQRDRERGRKPRYVKHPDCSQSLNRKIVKELLSHSAG